jgi:hypothetical protein
LSRYIVAGFDPASDSWLAALAELPTLEIDIDIAFIEKLVDNLTRRDYDPERCAKKGWNLGSFTLVTFRQAVAVLIAQYFRCAVTANALTFAKFQMNTMKCAHRI